MKAKTVVAGTARLRCHFSGVALSLGGFRSSGWSFERMLRNCGHDVSAVWTTIGGYNP